MAQLDICVNSSILHMHTPTAPRARTAAERLDFFPGILDFILAESFSPLTMHDDHTGKSLLNPKDG